MADLLYIETSPRKDRSASSEVAQAFLAAYRAANPADTITTLDVWNTELPEFDGAAIAAKYAGIAGTALSPAQQRAWSRINALAQPFKTADKLLFAIPMWNFSIPYKLKHLIDVISQKDVLFTFDATGFGGLLTGKKAAVIYARGIEYTPVSGTPAEVWDHQQPYIELWLRFIGVTDIATILVEKTLCGPEVDQAARDEAKTLAVRLANTF